jgi:hypothetical protein
MNYAVGMGSEAIIYVSSFIKILSGIQKFTREDTQTHRQQCDLIILPLFLQNKESGFKYVLLQCTACNITQYMDYIIL